MLTCYKCILGHEHLFESRLASNIGIRNKTVYMRAFCKEDLKNVDMVLFISGNVEVPLFLEILI